MKRMLAGLALATAATAIVAAPAQAAPKDPVAAVKQQIRPGKGVKFAESTVVVSHSRREVLVRRNGTLQFGKSGVTASDVTGNLNWPKQDDDNEAAKAFASPEHMLTVGGKSYVQGGPWSGQIPEDKSWLKLPSDKPNGLYTTMGQVVDVTELATLKALLKNAKASGSGYAGKITFGELKKVSPSFRIIVEPKNKQLKTVITWKLSLNAKGLPTRLVTSYSAKAVGGGGDDPKALFDTDTRYTGWGSTVKIQAPPASQVATGTTPE
ncbi:hypothetical protein ACIBHX_09260 [Nonomuraea sp. NPDC050536]|uniref:hypothetical protein n=1 Tax=Nonomuraea sp. NPDC050536 TaxID=3364366 RepID=UPI0037C79A00